MASSNREVWKCRIWTVLGTAAIWLWVDASTSVKVTLAVLWIFLLLLTLWADDSGTDSADSSTRIAEMVSEIERSCLDEVENLETVVAALTERLESLEAQLNEQQER